MKNLVVPNVDFKTHYKMLIGILTLKKMYVVNTKMDD